MEVFGILLFANLFMPLPWQFLVLLCVYNGIGGALDHSGFYVPGTLVDGRYHFVHHSQTTKNYAELETLDWLCGTLAEYTPKDKHL